MHTTDYLQFALFAVIILGTTQPLGRYMAAVFSGEKTFLSRALRPVERLIRIGEVKRLTGLSTATLYRRMSAEEFPRPVRLGVAARAWPLSEVQNWIAGRIELRGGSNG